MTDKLFFQEIGKAKGGYLEDLEGTSRYSYCCYPNFLDQSDLALAYENREPFQGNSFALFDFETNSWVFQKPAQENILYCETIYVDGLIYYLVQDTNLKELRIYSFDPSKSKEDLVYQTDFSPRPQQIYRLLGPEICLFISTFKEDQDDDYQILYPYETNFQLNSSASLQYFDGSFFYGSTWIEEDEPKNSYNYYENFQVRDKEGRLTFEKIGTPYLTPRGEYILL